MQPVGSDRGRPATTLIRHRAPRPLLFPVIGLMAGVVVADTTGPAPTTALVLLILVFTTLVAAVFLRPWPRWSPTVVAVMALAAVGYARQSSVLHLPANHLTHVLTDGRVLTRVIGRIVSSPLERPGVLLNACLPYEPPDRTQFVVAAEKLDSGIGTHEVVGRLRVTVEATGLELKLGQRVELTGWMYPPPSERNPGDFDWSQWYREQGLAGGLIVDRPSLVCVLFGPELVWHRVVRELRARAQQLVLTPAARVAPDEGARLLEVMVLGQRGVADRAMNEAFLRVGGMHFLAVSGFHVGVLAVAVTWICRWLLRCGRRTTGVVLMLAMLVYAVVAESNAPVLRAVCLTWFVAAAWILNRPVSLINWLAGVVLLLLLWNPMMLFHTGFQLSFVQVLGLVLVVPRVERWVFRHREDMDDQIPDEAKNLPELLRRVVPRWLVMLAVACTVAYFIGTPLVLWHFERLAPWGIVGTFILSPLVIITILLSLMTMALNTLVPPVGEWFATVLNGASTALLGLAEWLGGWMGAVIERPAPPLWLVVGTYAAVLLMLRRWPRVRSRDDGVDDDVVDAPPVGRAVMVRAVVSLMLVFLWVGYVVLPPDRPMPGLSIHVLEVADGSCNLIVTGSGRAGVLDVGTNVNRDAGLVAARALRSLGVRGVETVWISHANFDHYSGLPTLMRSIPVRQWAVSPHFRPRGQREQGLDCLLDNLPLPRLEEQHRAAGDAVEWGDATLEWLWPPPELNDDWLANDRSMVVRVSANGRRLLFTGDIEREALQALLAAERAGQIRLQADVLLAPHHGAVLDNVTADFFAAVSPEVVIVSSREPRRRLTPMVQDVLGPAARVLTTGAVGAVTVRLTPAGGVEVETYLGD